MSLVPSLQLPGFDPDMMQRNALVSLFAISTLLGAAWTMRSSAQPIREATPPSPSAVAQDSADKDLRAGTTFTIDGGHSAVLFRVQHLGAGPFWGRFNKVSGEFRIDDAALSDSFVRASIPVESVDSNSAGRDRHLKGPDFFDAKEHPKMSFESTKVERGDKPGQYHVTGKLELRGKTREIKMTVMHAGTKKMSERFGLRSGYDAEFTIDRTDFGINYMAKGEALGKQVRVVIGIEGTVKK